MFRTIAKRVFLFLAVNFLILLTVSILLSLFNVQPYLKGYGLDVGSLLIFCLVWGMAGAFISLALSRKMAKWLMGVQVIDPENPRRGDQVLLDIVDRLRKNAGLAVMPEVGIYQSPEVNAFATGPSRSRSLVAVSSGLLQRMDVRELEGVLGHEVSHIANGDMVTMTLLQGIVNAFVMFFARILAYTIAKMGRKSDEAPSPILYYFLVTIFEIIFLILGSIVIATYSRFREFRADSGGARLAGRDNMINALRALERVTEIHDARAEQPAFQAMKISSSKSLLRIFATHPPLEERISRLELEG
jgi:heat shock protein HtpX